MLVIKRKIGESILLGDDIEVVISEISGDKVKKAIDAPTSVKIIRKELKETTEFNQSAVENINKHNLKELKENLFKK